MKSWKNLLIPLIVMGVLIVGLIVFLVIKNNSGSGEEEFDTNVLSIGPQDITELRVHRRNLEDDIVIGVGSDSLGSPVYSYNGVEVDDENYSLTAINNFMTVMMSYNVSSLVKNSGALSEYGLSDPEITIEFTRTDNTVQRVLLGDDTYDGSACYMKIDGDDRIFTVAVAKKVCANYTEIDFLKSQVLNIDFSQISTVQFDRTTDHLHLLATCEIYEDTGEPLFTIVEPYKIKASTYFNNLIKTICQLEIAKFIEIPDDQLESYGLNDPAFHILITLNNGQKTELYISQKLAGYYYGRMLGIDQYFMLSDMQITGLETPILTLLNSYVAYYTSSEISSISGFYGGENFRLEISLGPSGKYADPDSSVKLDNRNAVVYNSDGRIYASVLFESLATIVIGGIDSDATPNLADTIMTLEYVTNEYQTTKVDFVQRDADTYYVFINDEYSGFYVTYDELFRDGGTDTYSYGVWAAYQLLDTAIKNNVNGVYDIPEEVADN